MKKAKLKNVYSVLPFVLERREYEKRYRYPFICVKEIVNSAIIQHKHPYCAKLHNKNQRVYEENRAQHSNFFQRRKGAKEGWERMRSEGEKQDHAGQDKVYEHHSKCDGSHRGALGR